MLRGLINGALAGAAGTTALNAVTYADMAVRGRPASSMPEDVVDAMRERANVSLGAEGPAGNRRSGLGALMGMAVGVGVGMAYGAVGSRLPPVTATAGLAVAATAASTVPAAALGLTDPRRWQAHDWLADLIPHLAYGIVTRAAHKALTG